MAVSDPATLSTPAGDTEFNPADDSDGFYLTLDTTGLDQAPIRAVVEDRSQTDGGIVHDAHKGPRRVTVVAQYKIGTGTIADRDTALDALIAQLDSIEQADGTWTQQRTGGDRALTVRSEVNLASSGGAQLKQVIFGLVAADPDWLPLS